MQLLLWFFSGITRNWGDARFRVPGVTYFPPLASFSSQALANEDVSAGHRNGSGRAALARGQTYIHTVATRMCISLYSSFTRSTVRVLWNGLHQASCLISSVHLSDTDSMSCMSVCHLPVSPLLTAWCHPALQDLPVVQWSYNKVGSLTAHVKDLRVWRHREQKSATCNTLQLHWFGSVSGETYP